MGRGRAGRPTPSRVRQAAMILFCPPQSGHSVTSTENTRDSNCHRDRLWERGWWIGSDCVRSVDGARYTADVINPTVTLCLPEIPPPNNLPELMLASLRASLHPFSMPPHRSQSTLRISTEDRLGSCKLHMIRISLELYRRSLSFCQARNHDDTAFHEPMATRLGGCGFCLGGST